jgi:cell division transport system permease protein
MKRQRRAPEPASRAGGRAWLRAHADANADAARQLIKRPAGTALTIAVIGIALTVPAALYVALANLERVIAPWSDVAHISAFLRTEVDAGAATALAQRLDEWPSIESVQLVSKEAALQDLSRSRELGAAIALLGDNPLPDVLVVMPAATLAADVAKMDTLRDEIARQPEVDKAQVDTAWIRRLAALADAGGQLIALVAVAIAAGITLIVGNTIRLTIAQRQEEIAIAKLFGATDGFVRRPFLYAGLLQGLLGGVGAWLLVRLAGWLLTPSVARLASAYGADFALSGLNLAESAGLLGLGGVLGWSGAVLAVNLYLRDIDRALE